MCFAQALRSARKTRTLCSELLPFDFRRVDQQHDILEKLDKPVGRTSHRGATGRMPFHLPATFFAGFAARYSRHQV